MVGVILGIVSNAILLSSSDINNKLRMFAIAAVVFLIIALVGVLISNKIKSLSRVMIFLGAISNIPVSIYSGMSGNIIICVLCAISTIMLLMVGILQVAD